MRIYSIMVQGFLRNEKGLNARTVRRPAARCLWETSSRASPERVKSGTLFDIVGDNPPPLRFAAQIATAIGNGDYICMRDVKSFIVLNQFLVDPVVSVTASPDPTVYKSAGNRSTRNDDRPNVPNFGPCRGRLQSAGLINIVTVCNHGATPGRK
jgi:hypothetical protein